MDLHGLTVMFSDASEESNVVFGDNFSIALDFKSLGDLNRAYDALITGGKVKMEVQETFWGAYFAMCTDKFGITWQITPRILDEMMRESPEKAEAVTAAFMPMKKIDLETIRKAGE